jgi:RNA polymerase sigma-70 factor (ECF subfamily)
LPYLLGIARKQLLMHFRRLKRTPPDPLRDSVHGLVDVQRPSGAIAAAQDRHYLLMALRRLPIDLQIVLELYYWEDLSLAGVASVIDVPLGTVKSRLGRAKDALRKHLAELPLSEGAATASRTALDQWARGLRARGSP